jgi:membrane protein YqaA with SNARE-associated domain
MTGEPIDSADPSGGAVAASKKRMVVVLFEAFLVVVLGVFFLFFREIEATSDLLLLFLYSFPSEFLVGLVPHEPALIHYGQFHPLWVVTLVSVVSTVMAETLNYSFFGLFYEMPGFRAALQKEGVRKVTDLFSRAPFFAIVFCGFGPLPFFPIRFLVVITEYPRWKYLLAVFLSRTPRFYILAWIGDIFQPSKAILIGIFVGMLALVNIPAAVKIFGGRREGVSPQ